MTDRPVSQETPAPTREPLQFAAGLKAGTRLLGIDAGTKTLGLALSDVSRAVASPLLTIRRTKLLADLAGIGRITAEHGVSGLVIGYPVNLDGREGPRAQATRAFARSCTSTLSLPVLLWDERLSTQQAERVLIEADRSRKRRAELIDKLAATVILQSALDRLRQTS